LVSVLVLLLALAPALELPSAPELPSGWVPDSASVFDSDSVSDSASVFPALAELVEPEFRPGSASSTESWCVSCFRDDRARVSPVWLHRQVLLLPRRDSRLSFPLPQSFVVNDAYAQRYATR
jgi:hypothetical protein